MLRFLHTGVRAYEELSTIIYTFFFNGSRTADLSVMSLVEKIVHDGQNLVVRRTLVRRMLWKDHRRSRL